MLTRRFDFKYTPLSVSSSISTIGGVPPEQTYDAESGEYSPDYSLTPCIIQPTVGIIDYDRVLKNGSVNEQLSEMSWCQVVNGVEQKPLTTTNGKYVIITEGGEKGKLTWYVNASPQVSILLRFKAKYLDTRTGQVHTSTQDFTIVCRNATHYQPTLLLTAGDHTFYNPCRDPDKQVVKASLRLGTEECEASKRVFAWEIFRSSGIFSAVTADDLEVSLSSDGVTATVDRSLMGKRLILRCRAKYSNSGNPSSVALSDNSPAKSINIVRRIPKYDFDFGDVPYNLEPGTRSISPVAYISDTAGNIPNPTKELQVLWYMATNKHNASLSYNLLGYDMNPTIPTDLMDASLGGILSLDVKPLDPWALLVDADGKVIVDGDGAAIVFH